LISASLGEKEFSLVLGRVARLVQSALGFQCCRGKFLQFCVEAERESDFLGNLTVKIGIDGGGVVEDTSRNAIGFPILFKLLTKMGELIANDAESYRYLAESIRMHPGQEDLKQMMIDAGLERVEYFNMTGGVVAVHRGYKL
jgi:hypothetical protein